MTTTKTPSHGSVWAALICVVLVIVIGTYAAYWNNLKDGYGNPSYATQQEAVEACELGVEELYPATFPTRYMCVAEEEAPE